MICAEEGVELKHPITKPDVGPSEIEAKRVVRYHLSPSNLICFPHVAVAPLLDYVVVKTPDLSRDENRRSQISIYRDLAVNSEVRSLITEHRRSDTPSLWRPLGHHTIFAVASEEGSK